MEQRILIENIDPSQDLDIENTHEFIIINNDYEQMINLPKIGGVEVKGDKSLVQYGIQPAGNYLTSEIDPVYSADKDKIALKTELPTNVSELSNDTGFITNEVVNTHNISETSHNDIRQELNETRAIAEGRSRGRSWETLAELDAWLAIPENVATLNTGDNLYIDEIDTPDYWWNGTEKKILEGEKPDFTPYYTKEEADAQFVEAEVGKGLISDTEKTTFSGKISEVSHDGSLSGSGTSASPLSVARVELASYDEYLARKTAGTLVAGTIYYWGV